MLQTKKLLLALAASGIWGLGSSSQAEPRLGIDSVQLNEAWVDVFGADQAPLLDKVFKSIKDEIFAYGTTPPAKDQASTGGSSGGFGKPKPGTTPGSQTTIQYFPVKSFDAAKSQAILGASARLGILKGKYRDHIGFQYDSSLEDPKVLQERLSQREAAIDLERFTVSMAFYLSAEKMAQKCRFYQEAKSLAGSLGFNNETQAAVPLEWQEYLKEVLSFYRDSSKGFSKIPSELCSLSTVLSRGDVERTLKLAVDAQIEASMIAATGAFNTQLESRLKQLGTTVQDSSIDVPVRGIFALEKGFRDTSDLLKLVRSDLLGLYSSREGASSILKQVDDRLKNMNGTTSTLDIAKQELVSFQDFLNQFLMKLEAVPLTAGLSDAQRAQLGICLGISKVPTGSSSELAAYQDKFDGCLGKVAEVYSSIRTNIKDEPAVQSFAGYLGNLTNLYLTQWN